VTRQLRSPIGGLVRVLLAESNRYPEIRDIANHFWAARFQLSGAVVRRAVERGELPANTNPNQVLEALAGPLFMRTFLLFAPISEPYLVQHVNMILAVIRGPGAAPRRNDSTTSS
jgi:hypothetical protein